jgi:hypothetical protein
LTEKTEGDRQYMFKLADEFFRAAWGSEDAEARHHALMAVFATCDQRYAVGALLVCLGAIPDTVSPEEKLAISSTMTPFVSVTQ